MGPDKEDTKMDNPVPPSYTPHSLPYGATDIIEPLPPTYTEDDNNDSHPSPIYTQSSSNVDLTPSEIAGIRALRQRNNDNNIYNLNEATPSIQLFAAIDQGNQEWIARLLSAGSVTANTKHRDETPLLRAIKTRNVQIVQQLLEAGANVDEFGCVSTQYDKHTSTTTSTLRTPLQLASTIGHLPLVKLLIEQHHATDSLVAPDGQIALRLAAEHNHPEIVAYLPSRRTGGFKRWQFKNRKSLQRIRKICKRIGQFVKFFVWDLEVFFLWTVPKHVLVKPVLRGCKWCWERRGRLGPWCKHQVMEMPGRIKRAGVWAGKQVVKIPRGVASAAKGTWRFGTETLPRLMKDFSVWFWKLLTVKLPKALKIFGHWIRSGITSLSKTIWNAILKVISFFSTILSAIISFFKSLTLRDIWNGFVEILRAIFVTLPKMILSWIKAFGDTSYKMMKALFGLLGQIVWFLGYGILWVVTFLPRQLWKILESIGASLAKAGYEVKVWVNPKAR
ncbi:ankyrin repeat-containing domain protein [Cadophora sp. MPI-SDFR-AT-0126]|nr:ankyrin repeat-containing domain protein [Leotiomycetes sp. MPI-SDFR-AT-0126]